MSLYAKGEVLNCRARSVNYKDKATGEPKSFVSHTVCVFDRSSDGDPIKIDMGDSPLGVGKFYRIPVRVSVYTPDGGRPMIQYHGLKDDPPKEYKPSAGV